MKNTVRLDTLLVDRGLAASRERARALILTGNVRVNGQPASKAGTAVARMRTRKATPLGRAIGALSNGEVIMLGPQGLQRYRWIAPSELRAQIPR